MIAECLLIKNENRYLLEHLTYNAAAGIYHFFIFDNLSDTPVADFLRENARQFLNICTVARYHSNRNLQLDCYADYLKEHRHVDWTVFCDTDECFTGNIRDAVAEFGGDYNYLSFAPILHGCNGKIFDDGGGMFDRFASDIVDPAHSWYKCLARTSDVALIKSPHKFRMIGTRLIYLSQKKYSQCVLHHFRFRSFEEWVSKIKRGTCLSTAPNDSHAIKEFFNANKSISQDNPDIISLMKWQEVTMQTKQSTPPIL